MEKEVRVESVTAYQTKSGNTRYVLRDEEGNEFTNVYLDKVEPLEEDENGDGGARSPEEEAGWGAAVEAAPYLLGATEARSRSTRTSCSRS